MPSFLVKILRKFRRHVREPNYDITQAQLSIEIERKSIHRHLLMRLALVAGEKGIVPDLIVVLANSREIDRVFPSKRSHR